MRLSRMLKNWTVHNLISHPMSELVYLLTRREDWAGWVHDITVPDHNKGTGKDHEALTTTTREDHD